MYKVHAMQKLWKFFEAEDRAVFQDSPINVTMEGRPRLGAPLGSQAYIESLLIRRLINGNLFSCLLRTWLPPLLMRHAQRLPMEFPVSN